MQKQKFGSQTWMWWFMPVTPAPRRQRQESHCELEANLGMGEGGKRREKGTDLWWPLGQGCFLPVIIIVFFPLSYFLHDLGISSKENQEFATKKKNYGKEDERLTHVRGMRAWPLR